MAARKPYTIACSRKAWREGIWPILEWAVFDLEGNILRGGFRTSYDARVWAENIFA